MINNNKKLVDLPFFELCNQAPLASSTLSAMTRVRDATGRYIYYISTATFYRYDTYADTWQQLATPITAPVTLLDLKYVSSRGYHGRVLSATSSSVQIPGLRGNIFNGLQIQIVKGTGVGQTRTLTYTSETIADSGIITATTVSNIADSTKKWIPNQWAGYLVGITFGTDATQYKKVLYNDTTTLYIQYASLQQQDPWNNQYFSASAPYAVPVVTAGSQAHYIIMSSSYTLDSNWTVTPDATSLFTTLTGGIYMFSSAAAAPFMTLQYYDVLSDAWQIKTVPQSLIGAAFGTDCTINSLDKLGSALTNNLGVVSSTARTLVDAGQAMVTERYNNHRIVITGGTGIGQTRRISGNLATTFTVAQPWVVNPDATSTYQVWADFDKTYIGGNGAAALYAYSSEKDYWMQGQDFDDNGLSSTGITATFGQYASFAVTSGVRITSGIQAINTTPTAGGTLYSIGDILTCAVGGAGAQVVVTSITSGGVVTGLQLLNSGTTTGYTVSTGNATTGGTGTLCTLAITTVGPTALITLPNSHTMAIGNSITFAGCNEALWNAAYTIIGVNGITSFSVATTATLTMATTAAQSTTTIVDSTKNWVVNEHVGRLVHLCVAGTGPTSQIRWVISNTATVLTVATIVAAAANSKYCIYDARVFGCDDQRKESNKQNTSYATSGTTTTLVDTSRNWVPGMWVGYLFKVTNGTGYGSGKISITANTATSLTFSVQTFTPDTTTKYEIADTWGLISTGGTTTPVTEATSKNWVVNQWAGKRFRITGGTAPGQETSVTSNTATVITSAALTLTDATSTYAILSIPARSTGISLIWAFGGTAASTKGRFIYYPRGGGSNTLDTLDITTGSWLFGTFVQPQSELFTTGSSYCYDGVDTLYLSRSLSGAPIRIFTYDIPSNKLVGFATTTILQGTTTVGNFMEIITDPTGTIKFLYSLQNTGTLLTRALIS